MGEVRGHARHDHAVALDRRVLRLRPLQRDRPDRRAPVPADRRARAGLARGRRARRVQCAPPDHARRRPQLPEPGSRDPPQRRDLRPRQSVPRRRHGGERDGRAGLRLRPLQDPADRGSRLQRRQPAPGRAGGRRRQPHRRLVQRPQLLHDAGPPRRQHPGGVPAAADEDHRGDHETRRRRRRPDRDREQRRGDRRPRRRPQRRERRGHVRLHRHGRDRHGRDQGRVRLQAGTRDAGRRLRDPRLVGRPALHRHAEPSGSGTDVQVERERGRVHRGRQPPQVEGLGLQRRRRSRHRRRIRQLQPHAHVRGRGARRLARDAIRPAAATTTS